MPLWMYLVTTLEDRIRTTGRQRGDKDAARSLAQHKITNLKNL